MSFALLSKHLRCVNASPTDVGMDGLGLDGWVSALVGRRPLIVVCHPSQLQGNRHSLTQGSHNLCDG